MDHRDTVFAGLDVLNHGWQNVTNELSEGAPYTLAKAGGIGVLTVFVAPYPGGGLEVDEDTLERLLDDWRRERGPILHQHKDTNIVWGEFGGPNDFFRVWYKTDGRNVVSVTYATQEVTSPSLTAEVDEADAIVRSIRF